MKRWFVLPVAGLFLILFMVPPALSAEGEGNVTTIDAEGVGAVANNNKALGRDSAIRDALRKAVEQAVGTFISSDTVVKNYEVLSDRIYSRSQGYVRNYSILYEDLRDDLYHVKVRAVISLGGIKDDLQALGLLMARMNMPRIMVLIAEQNVGQSHPSYYWQGADLSVTEGVIHEKFLKDGFTFVDRTPLAGKIKVIQDSISDSEAAGMGRQVDAELVILGKGFAKYASNIAGTAMKSFQANVTAKVVRVDTGMVIASASGHGAAVHIDDITGGTNAFQKAAESVADSLKSQIIAKWQSEVGSTTLVSLTVRGLKSYSDFIRLKDALKTEARGVQEIFLRKMEGGTAKMDLQIEGSALSLADELAMAKFQGFSLDITNVSQNSLEANMVK